jgi:type IV secretion system protein VirB2
MQVQQGGKNKNEAALRTALTFIMSMTAASMAMAGSPEAAASGIIDTVVAVLQAVGVGVFTIAIMWAGYRVAFQGARFSDVANIIIGGILVGGAAVFAGWLMGGT